MPCAARKWLAPRCTSSPVVSHPQSWRQPQPLLLSSGYSGSAAAKDRVHNGGSLPQWHSRKPNLEIRCPSIRPAPELLLSQRRPLFWRQLSTPDDPTGQKDTPSNPEIPRIATIGDPHNWPLWGCLVLGLNRVPPLPLGLDGPHLSNETQASFLLRQRENSTAGEKVDQNTLMSIVGNVLAECEACTSQQTMR